MCAKCIAVEISRHIQLVLDLGCFDQGWWWVVLHFQSTEACNKWEKLPQNEWCESWHSHTYYSPMPPTAVRVATWPLVLESSGQPFSSWARSIAGLGVLKVNSSWMAQGCHWVKAYLVFQALLVFLQLHPRPACHVKGAPDGGEGRDKDDSVANHQGFKQWCIRWLPRNLDLASLLHRAALMKKLFPLYLCLPKKAASAQSGLPTRELLISGLLQPAEPGQNKKKKGGNKLVVNPSMSAWWRHHWWPLELIQVIRW